MGQEKVGLRSLPTIVHPKPIFGRLTNLLLDGPVFLRGDGVHRVTGRINQLRENHPPAARPFCVNRRRHHRRARSFCQQARERRSRGELSEKRRPKTVVARVLVRKNPKKPAGSKQLDWLVKSFASVEKLRAGAGPPSAGVSVNVTVPQAL